MNTNITSEVECKYKINSLADYHQVLEYLKNSYSLQACQKLTNYLLDTTGFKLRERKLILRMRISPEQNLISLKGKNQIIDGLNFARRIEIEFSIEREDVEKVKKRGIYLSDLSEDIKKYLINEFKTADMYFVIWGNYKVNRQVFDYKNIAQICLDEVFYPDLIDYELELELYAGQKVENADNLVVQLEKHPNFKLQPSHTTKSELLQKLIKQQDNLKEK
ncbi:MAG: CYTH domain-containing protein [bacterium]